MNLSSDYFIIFRFGTNSELWSAFSSGLSARSSEDGWASSVRWRWSSEISVEESSASENKTRLCKKSLKKMFFVVVFFL